MAYEVVMRVYNISGGNASIKKAFIVVITAINAIIYSYYPYKFYFALTLAL